MKNLGVSVEGELKKSKPHKFKTKKSASKGVTPTPEEGTVNKGTRTTKIEYLRHHTNTVATMNEKGEYEIKSTDYCGEGDTVWVLEKDNTFTETKIY